MAQITIPDSKVHGANMGPTWVLSAPDGPHVGPMNLAIRDTSASNINIRSRVQFTVHKAAMQTYTQHSLSFRFSHHKDPCHLSHLKHPILFSQWQVIDLLRHGQHHSDIIELIGFGDTAHIGMDMIKKYILFSHSWNIQYITIDSLEYWTWKY